MVYTVIKIVGVDAVKISVYKERQHAEENIKKWLRILDTNENVKIIIKDDETHFIVNKSDNAKDHIEFILKETKIL